MPVRHLLNPMHWPVVVLLAFGLVYARSLTFEFAEGDDATSIAYHAMGRNEAMQPVYASYQSGADLLLSLTPPDEPTLRVLAIALTSVAMVVCTVLMLMLVFDMLGDAAVRRRGGFALLVVLAIPELFYLGLVYQPPVMGMCLMLSSHLMLRSVLRHERTFREWQLKSWGKVILAAGLFGLGGAFRWNLVIYGWLIFWDWFLCAGRQPANAWGDYVRRGAHASIWVCTAVGAWLAVLAISGYGLQDVLEFQQGARRLASDGFPWQALLAADLSFVTPALAVLSLWGLVSLVRRQIRLAAFAAISTVPVLPLLGFWPKQLLWFFPIVILCLASGYVATFEGRDRTRWSMPLQVGLIALLVLPWAVGVRATSGDTAWGPGFQLRPYDRERSTGSSQSLTLGAGAAVSTFEGPRPLWGHGAVLLGSEWRRLILESRQDRSAVIRTAIDEGLPILLLEGNSGLLVCELARLGFVAIDEFHAGADPTFQFARHFANSSKHTVILLRLANDAQQWAGDAHGIRAVARWSDRVVVTGYPGTLRVLYRAAPKALRKIGLTSAVVSLQMLAEVARIPQRDR